MGVHLRDIGLQWTPFSGENSQAVMERMASVLKSWYGTPYTPGIIKRGRDGGVFCTAFVARVLDELYRQEPTELPVIPHDAAFHNRRRAEAALRWFMRRYPESYQVEGFQVEPGDLLMTGPPGGGPGHCLMVGPRENVAWQASGSSVHYTGLYLPDPYECVQIRRFKDREIWA